ncbi:Nif3-like dinuclear metal center hexameric protein [Enterococcus faecalis]|uniref:Nif3-like dinuclear metal center hexameric protein n=1 Tax=Enterococcus faecalis TaxID=1351 RepID=UPI0038602053
MNSLKVNETISEIKTLYRGESYLGVEFTKENTRDKVLFGQKLLDEECTGVVVSCWASMDVIEQAHFKGANLIIVHEALFWNHGDKQEWLKDNETFQMKKELLEKYKIVVWRNHDYVHSGILTEDGSYVDGIFLGLIKQLEWENFIDDQTQFPLVFEFKKPKLLVEIAKELIEKLQIHGVKVMGNDNQKINKLVLGLHALGDDNHSIALLDQKDVDALLLLEMVDFTVLEYAFDSFLAGRRKGIISAGHFNTEAPGMAYMAEYLLKKLNTNIDICYVNAGDMTHYIIKE